MARKTGPSVRTKEASARGGGWRRSRSFVLLEILIAVVLLGTALTAMLRCFTNGLKSVSRDRKVTQGVLLAQGLLDDYEIEAPESDHVEGDFGPDFPGFSYTADFEWVEVKYRNIDLRLTKQEFDPLRKVTLCVYYRPSSMGKATQVVGVETYLTGIEKHATQSKLLNALF